MKPLSVAWKFHLYLGPEGTYQGVFQITASIPHRHPHLLSVSLPAAHKALSWAAFWRYALILYHSKHHYLMWPGHKAHLHRTNYVNDYPKTVSTFVVRLEHFCHLKILCLLQVLISKRYILILSISIISSSASSASMIFI